MDLTVVIPYRETDIYRQRNFEVVSNWWKLHGHTPLVGDSGDKEFSRSKSRNIALKQVQTKYTVIADADTLVPYSSIEYCINELEQGSKWLIAHDVYYNVNEQETALRIQENHALLGEPQEGKYDHRIKSWAGMLVLPTEVFTTRKLFYDPRFVAWSYEDNAFVEMVDTLWGKHTRSNNYAIHLWHPRGPDFSDPRVKDNQRLYRRYQNASGNVAKMQRLVDEYVI